MIEGCLYKCTMYYCVCVKILEKFGPENSQDRQFTLKDSFLFPKTTI
jgi:hypothetical protein